MGDVLPLKRQTVVDRLRVRLERYRWHHNSCLPRYEQSANSLCEKQRQDTVRLRQKFLESKAKKTKSSKSDHHKSSLIARELTPDAQKLVVQHPKPIKTLPDDSPTTATPEVPVVVLKTEEAERLAKVPTSENASDPKKEQHKTQNFTLQIGSQFAKCKPSVQGNPAAGESQQPQKKKSSTAKQNRTTKKQSISALNLPTQAETVRIVECKQEIDRPPDICEFKNTTQDAVCSDRLSDTFPSLGFAEDSGDDVIHPDLLKDIIDDVFTNSADIMKDFNFEGAVSSLRDDEKDDIEDLVKSSASELRLSAFPVDLMFGNHSISQDRAPESALYDNPATSNASSSIPPVTTVANTPAVPSMNNSGMYGAQQRMQNYSESNAMNMDFKLSEPSPAALTLKQMAEQHQNMQQKQLTGPMSAAYNPRNHFSMDTFPESAGNFRTKMLNRAPVRMQNSIMFHSMPYRPDNAYPGVTPINNANTTLKQELCNTPPNHLMPKADIQKNHLHWLPNDAKLPLPGHTGKLNFYPENSLQNPSNPHIPTSQFVEKITPNIQLQIQQNQPLSSPAQNITRQGPAEMKQPEVAQNPYRNIYSYNNQQGTGQMFNTIPQSPVHSASYSMLPNNNNIQPQLEYKLSQSVIRPGNVPLQQIQVSSAPYLQLMSPTLSTSNSQWWSNQQQQNHTASEGFQQQAGYATNYTGSMPSSMSHTAMHHPYRTMGQQVSANRMPPSSLVSSAHLIGQQQSLQANLLQQHPNNSNYGNVNTNVNTQLHNIIPDISNRQDNQISLDFLDQIESSAPYLLNFDQVMQNTGITHFQLLDDMEMLSK